MLETMHVGQLTFLGQVAECLCEESSVLTNKQVSLKQDIAPGLFLSSRMELLELSTVY